MKLPRPALLLVAPVLLAFGTLWGSSPARAADDVPFIVREWHREDGLPSEVVTDIAQDHEGYLWLTTAVGLVRFDGRTFRLHAPPLVDGDGRPTLIAVADRGDALWLATRSGGVLRFRAGAFTSEPFPNPAASRTMAAAWIAPDGAEWVVWRGEAAVRRKDGSVQTFPATPELKLDSSTRFASDRDGAVWISCGSFLGRYDGARLAPVETGLGGSELRVVSSRKGGPWIITRDQVVKLDPASQPRVLTTLPALVGAHYVSSACEDRDGVLWIGTRSQGVYRTSAAGAVHVPTSHEGVSAVHEDNEGNIWVGTNGGGLHAIGPRIHRLYDKSSGLGENATYSLCEAREGTIWVANGDGGVVRVAPDGAITRPTGASWPYFGVVSIAAHSSGEIRLGGSPGVFELDADAARPPHVLATIPGGVRQLFIDSAGDTWLAANRTEIGSWSRANGLRTYGEREGYTGGEPRCFAQGQDGAVWVGTTQGRLFRGHHGRFEPVTFSARLPLGGINAIRFDDDGSIWLATARAGLVVLAGGNATILDSAAGMPDNNLSQLVADDHGFLWCGSGTGVFRLSLAEVKRVVAGEAAAVNAAILGRDEGLRAVACSGIYFPGSLKARDGRLWFATRQGLLVIDPAAPLLNSGPRRVRVEEIAMDGRAVRVAPGLSLPPEVRKIEFRFSVLSLSAPRRTRVEYRLDGFDPDWIPAGAATSVSYPRLQPGTYTFHLRAGTAASDASPVEDGITFTVPARWWQTPWFAASAFVGVILLVAAGVRLWSTRRLRRRLREVERERAIESERARIAQNIHDDVGASLTHISLLTQSHAPGGTAEQLNRIYEATREITRSLDEIVWAVNPEHDSLEGFADYVASFAQRFLAAAGLHCRLDFPDLLPAVILTSQQRHHLFLCCREALNNVVKHAHATGVTIRMQVGPAELTLGIADDGTGLPAAPAGGTPARQGNGLRNLQRRMAQLGGTCTIDRNAAGPGTIVTLRAPLPPRHAAP